MAAAVVKFLKLEKPNKYAAWDGQQLKEECKQRKLTATGKKKLLQERLVRDDSGLSSRGPNRSPSNTYEKFMDTCLKGWYMPKLSAKQKEYCKVGHENEMTLAEKVLEHSSGCDRLAGNVPPRSWRNVLKSSSWRHNWFHRCRFSIARRERPIDRFWNEDTNNEQNRNQRERQAWYFVSSARAVSAQWLPGRSMR